MYKKWLTLPDKMLIREGTKERERLAAILWGAYCKLYQKAYHEVVKEYFRGGNWQSYLKQLVKEMRKNENNFDSANSLRIDINHHTDCI